MTLGKKIKAYRESLNLTQSDLAKKLGTTKQTIFKYENEIITNIPSDKIEMLANLFGISPAVLMGWENAEPIKLRPTKQIPVYGTIPAGIAIEAIEDISGYIDIDASLNGEYLGLKVKGDSMYPKYIEDDIVIIKLQPDCESGQDCAVYVNGYDVTLKKVIKTGETIILQPLNNKYEPKIYPSSGDGAIVSILGVVKELRRKI